MSHNKPAQKTILVVEDSLELSAALQTKLGKAGYIALVAFDGQEGLDLALKHKPDLILLDLILPRVSGVEFLAQLSEDKWGKKVPVIILSNLTHFTHLEEMYDGNVEAYLIKTAWSLEDVIKKVASVLA
ncbi:response regulator [candidate division WWE3 bacterium]|jgi:DNA-binding response OmpR family regulator|nr:response regulator [candidate division WWE3 bacterium]MBT7350438.1 response regulator [candidate division WWE3 bacterium]